MKFKVGDEVYCFRHEAPTHMGFDFSGRVLHVNDTGEGEEYIVENSPTLPWLNSEPLRIWDEEMWLICSSLNGGYGG